MASTYLITYKRIPQLSLFKNSGKKYSFEVRDDFNKIIDITNATITFNIFLELSGTNDSPILTKAGTVLDGELGLFDVEFTPNEVDFESNKYSYIVEIDLDGSQVLKFGTGVFEVLGDDTERVLQIKQLYGLNYEYFIMKQALEYAHTEIRDKAFKEEKVTFAGQKQELEIDNYVGDRNLDGELTVDDVQLYQYQYKSPYGYEEKNNSIDNIVFNHPSGKTIIQLNETLPTDTSWTLELKYSKSDKPLDEIKTRIERLEEYLVIYYLFTTLSVYKLQEGMTSKNLMGVDISFDKNSIDEFIKQLRNKIQFEYFETAPTSMTSVKIPKTY